MSILQNLPGAQPANISNDDIMPLHDLQTGRDYHVTIGNLGQAIGGGANLTGAAIFLPPTDDYAGIMAAIAACVAAGGGTVQLKAVTYDIGGNTIPLTAGIHIRGAGFEVNTGNQVIAGTIIRGDGTAVVVGHSIEDGVSLPVGLPELRATVCYAPTLSDLCIEGGTYGLKVGARYKGGAYFGTLRNLRVQNCSVWNIYLENWQYSRIEQIYSGLTAGNNAAHMFFGASTEGLFNHGNCYIAELFAEGGGNRSRGFVFRAYGATTALNDVHVYKLQRNAKGEKQNYAATMTNGSADIGVPDSTLFPIDFPVTVAASVNGFTQYQTYFVISSAANVIQVSDVQAGAAKTATGSTAASLETYGFPALEIVGYGSSTATGGLIQPCSFVDLDLEGIATTLLVLQQCNVDIDVSTTFANQGFTGASVICARNVLYASWQAVGRVHPDFDSFSASRMISKGYSRETTSAVALGSNPFGLVRTSALLGMQFTVAADGFVPSLFGVNTSGLGFLYPSASMGQRIGNWNTSTLSVNGTRLGSQAYIGTVNSVVTLPTLTGATGGATNSYPGSTVELANCSTTGGVTVTINAAAGQGFNRTADVSVTLAVGQSISLRAQTTGTDWFWQIIGASPGVTL